MNDILLRDLAEFYHLIPQSIQPVRGGWLNRKWKITTDAGEFLVKQYSLQRFRRNQLDRIGEALTRQIRLHERGIPCPGILTPAGQPLRYANEETVYMVMEFVPGYSAAPETVTARQMNRLGSVLGRIHRELMLFSPEGVKGYPPNDGAMLEGLRQHSRTSEFAAASMQPVLRTLTPDAFASLPRGIAHEDFSPDNILFRDADVAAVLDFDRMQYSFLYHDVGRALLSLAWKDGVWNLAFADAFRRGYAESLPLSPADLADALRVTWCMEASWWIHESVRESGSEKIRRFLTEILWVGEHWEQLDVFFRSEFHTT